MSRSVVIEDSGMSRWALKPRHGVSSLLNWRLWRAGLFVLVVGGLLALGMAGCRSSHSIGAPSPTPVALATTEGAGPAETPTHPAVEVPSVSTPSPTSTATATWTPTPTSTSIPSTCTPIPTSTHVPPPTPSLTEIAIGPREGCKVHIGFDVEGDPRILYKILDVLAEEHYRTTFFLQGEWVRYHPEATRRIVAAGHELGNHSWSHRDICKLSDAEIERELQDTESLVVKLTGHSTKPFFRPPYGARDERVREVAYRLGYTTVMWTFGGQDWVTGADADSVYHNIVDHAVPGAIFYLHTSHAYDPPAVKRAIQTLRERGYRLVSLSELVAQP
ncbi:MAG: polysaccharide deacetylase family protein [Anaerolineae bacterium]|nr:polysaccharide deacetylase family protein [Anaerolineae bacterium]